MHELNAAERRHLIEVDELNERATQLCNERKQFESELEHLREKDVTSSNRTSGYVMGPSGQCYSPSQLRSIICRLAPSYSDGSRKLCSILGLFQLTWK